MDYRSRLTKLRSALTANRLHALLLSSLPNIRYLCGFTGSSAALLVTPITAWFFTDGRYTAQARDEVTGAKIKIGRKPALTAAAEWLISPANRTLKQLGVESDYLTFADSQRLKKIFGSKIRIRPTSALVEALRGVKDSQEVECLRRSANLGSSLFEIALTTIAPGVSEVKVAAEIEYAARRYGADAMSFETIIAAGARSALPHGRASSFEIPSRGFVVCDFGVVVAGYCSDMTRTVYVGQPSRRERDLYHAVQAAQAAAVEAVGPGVPVSEVDRAARNVLKKKGLGRHFTHSTGHGVGLEIHEAPRIAADQSEPLQPGVVITVEPGAYLPGEGGVRIEDMVLVTEQGSEVLTPTSRELITI
jgi:Xaa-Pro aminopeptidase